jgi:hypothetical protein
MSNWDYALSYFQYGILGMRLMTRFRSKFYSLEFNYNSLLYLQSVCYGARVIFHCRIRVITGSGYQLLVLANISTW